MSITLPFPFPLSQPICPSLSLLALVLNALLRLVQGSGKLTTLGIRHDRDVTV